MAAVTEYSVSGLDVAPAAALLADPARAAMLTALLDDRPLAAGELARLAGVSPATASAHLTRLRDGGLVSVVSQGRHRYYRLSGHEVAAALEALGRLAAPSPVRSLRASRQAAALADARTCYDHLAGALGVALLDALLAGALLAAPAGVAAPDGPAPAAFVVTDAGIRAFGAFGIDCEVLRGQRRRFAGACLDWTQRRPHLSGALGAALTTAMFQRGWLQRGACRRAVWVTSQGQAGLAETFGCSAGT